MSNPYPLFSDIYGQNEAVDSFKELLLEIQLSHIYKLYNEYPSKGYLLNGPKGTGKTSCVRALANELEKSQIHSSLFHLSYMDIANSYLDKPIQNLKAVFDFVDNLSKKGHVIIFVDEIDTMFPNFHDHMHEQDKKRVNIFLEWMDGGIKSTSNVTILGATNEIKAVHNSILRPGRFDKVIHFYPLKAKDVWQAVLSNLVASTQSFEITFNPDNIIHLLEGFNGADARFIASRLIKFFIKEHISLLDKENIKYNDIEKAINTKPELKITEDIFINTIKSIKPSETRISRPIGFNMTQI